MAFKLVICPPNYQEHWPDLLRQEIPDIDVQVCPTVGEAMEVIGDADAAFGDIRPELLERAHNLKWIACPQAGPRAGYYHDSLIDSDVVVTNTREIYNDHISAHIMSLLLAFARGLQVYIPQQVAGVWRQGYPTIYLPEATAVIVGVGGIGGETARLCSEFGMTVLAVDPRLPEPTQGVAELHRPDALLEVLPRADFVILTVPETPETQGMFRAEQFRAMKNSAFFINIGRGATVILDDLVDCAAGCRRDRRRRPRRVPNRTVAGRTPVVEHAQRADHAPRRRQRPLPRTASHRALHRQLQAFQRRPRVAQRSGQGQLVLIQW